MNTTINFSSIEAGDEFAVTYKDGSATRAATVRVTDAAPGYTPLGLGEGAVACVTLGPTGPTKNEGYLGESTMGGRPRLVPSHGWFPSATVESIRRVEAED